MKERDMAAEADKGAERSLRGVSTGILARSDDAAEAVFAAPESCAVMPNNPGVSTILAAIFKGGPGARSLIGGWQEGENGRPEYCHNGNKGGRIVVYVDPVGTGEGSLPTTEDLWAFIDGLSPFTADVALAVLAHFCDPDLGHRPKYPLVEAVCVSADSILAYKGIRRWGLERRRLREQVAREMARLGDLRFNIRRYPAWDPEIRRWNSMGVSSWGDRLFDIVGVEQFQDSETGQTPTEVAWLVRAGHWAHWWLNSQGRVWVSRMALALLELDHRANRGSAVMAKKIGQHTTLLAGALRGRDVIRRRIDRLLVDIGKLPEPKARGPHWAGRTRDRFDDAMQALIEAGVFTGVAWPDGFGPGDDDRRKGWVKRWLAAKVIITLPRTRQRHGKRKGDRSRDPRGPQGANLASRRAPGRTEGRAEGLRGARIASGYSQVDLARELAVSATYLSRVENGKIKGSQVFLDRLETWLANR